MTLGYPKRERTTARKYLTEEQIQYLSTHQVMSITQLNQLARQIKLLRRICERMKLIASQKPIGYRSSNIQPSWGADLGLKAGSDTQQPMQAAKRPRKQSQKQQAKQPKKRKKAEQEEEEEEEEEMQDSDMTEDEDVEAAQVPPGEHVKQKRKSLRPRSKTSLNLGHAAEASDADDSTDTDEGFATRGSKGRSKRHKRQITAVDQETDNEPAQLMTMQPVQLKWDADNVICGVCGDDEQAEGNEILLCDGAGCDVAVHQQCFGLTRVPRGKWFCDACTDKLDLSKPNCVCCPVTGGVLRKVKELGDTKLAKSYHNKKSYLHVACALWTPEIIITEPDAMRAPSLEGLRQHRVDLTCAICKQAGGAVIQCSFGVCTRAFHVLCGRHVKAAAAFRHTDGHPLAFCIEHSKERYERTRDKLIVGDDMASPDVRSEGFAAEAPAGPIEPNEYEVLRQQNIERNRQMLASLSPAS